MYEWIRPEYTKYENNKMRIPETTNGMVLFKKG